MIQRIQSLFLLMTTILSFLFLKGAILRFSNDSGSAISVTFSGILKFTEGQNYELIEKALPLSVLIILIPVISLFALFCYKNRKLQLSLTISAIVLTAVLILTTGYCIWHVSSLYGVNLVPGFRLILPLLMLVFLVLAYRGIRKDDQLVKSYDRLR
jgi:hypothetical protein